MTNGKHLVAAHVDQALHDKLEATSQALGISKAALVRYLLRTWLESPVVLAMKIKPPPFD
jgi:hypothetical protein